MTHDTWTAVDDYFASLLIPADSTLDAALAASRAAGLPAIHVSPMQGKFLHLLALLQNARSILEIGTLGGYSTIWLARALPQHGRLVTLEINPDFARVAQANIHRAGLAGRVDLRVGQALELLPRLAAEKPEPFDLVFIDADKPNNAAYFEWALTLARPGGLILIDNVVRNGAVIDPHSDDASVQGTRRSLEAIAAEPRITATALQTVGCKGYDGLIIARIRDR